jgi:diguanylate cyclase (GGDEF)-like protein
LNDTLGHEIGDLLLQEAAKRLGSRVREVDTVARLSSDEFVVMLEKLSQIPEVAAAEAEAVAAGIRSLMGQPYLLAGHDCRSTSSIGVTIFGDQAQGSTEVLQQAEIAMFQAKDVGRNTIRFFAPSLQAAANARAKMEVDLGLAIESGQLVLHYQPQVECGVLIGAEALIRWNHPERGILLPAEFIAVAEDTGLILRLGDWILEAACQQIASWSAGLETIAITISVNISAAQVRRTDFVEQVLDTLDRTTANPKILKLELTESMLLDNVEDVIAKMIRLKHHGLKFSLDDFGTGYSSLNYLKRLPLDQLKIDRAFVKDILEDDRGGAIAETIISLGRALGLSVIAEGVETAAQRDYLAHLGCHAHQGYLAGKPIPPEQFELLLSGLRKA